MIVVDSSVWIGHFRDVDIEPVRKFRALSKPSQVVVGDLVLLEVLQGARDELHAAQLEQILRQFRTEAMVDERLAVQAGRNYRMLRARGVTVRTTVDLIIATFCEDRGYQLLHNDRDFDAMAAHLGLTIV